MTGTTTATTSLPPEARTGRTAWTDRPGQGGAWPLPHRPEAVRAARSIAREVLALWKVTPEVADVAVLVVSELVTNAVEHASPPLTLHLSRVPGDGAVHVEVTDGGPAATEGDWAASCAEGERGRGLTIIDTVAAAHGDHWQTGHATHWADLTPAA
ncbi:ATP-binding protein [Streptomyces piniterrae]|uniref:ATP-binding protein n=1 Tax=Streptomyces piniterrae TaxID=2571125 RepID=A0A4U0MU15_9ACTN|nr:ATP-binding protein [Streptomyces piniterrae]TJZ44501.1 ATP-binding protein [Streptomyces piniterrae]